MVEGGVSVDLESWLPFTLGFGVVVGIALIARHARREKLPISPRPAVPTVPAAAPPQPPKVVATHEVVSLRPGIDLGEQIVSHAHEAERRGLRPFLEFTASWCPPSAAFDGALDHPLMVQALTGTYLIRVDIDEFGGFSYEKYGFKVFGVPLFFELDAEGRPTGRQITSNAWGPDIPENMSRVMGAFFRG
jgi:hypothetical protein